MSADVLAVAEHRRGDLRDVSFELLTAGRQLADETGGELHAAVISGDIETFGDRLAWECVDAVRTVAYGEEFNHDVYVQAVTAVVDELDPAYVLAPHSINSFDYVPAVADRLSVPLVTDVTGLAVDSSGLTATQEFHGGKTEETIELAGDRAALTIRAGEWPAASGSDDATVEPSEIEIDESAVRSTVTGFNEVGGDVDIADADVLVSVGRGIQEEDNLDLIFDLADAMDATVSASGPIIDNGWLPADRQVGQSGKIVTPEVYIAIGISGAIQHVAGMKGAETIVAINNDPSAPGFDIADYGIVDDLFEVVPALTAEFAG